jgi:hypothetical protein
MNDKDPVMVDLDRYLAELEEDYVDPADAKKIDTSTQGDADERL